VAHMLVQRVERRPGGAQHGQAQERTAHVDEREPVAVLLYAVGRGRTTGAAVRDAAHCASLSFAAAGLASSLLALTGLPPAWVRRRPRPPGRCAVWGRGSGPRPRPAPGPSRRAVRPGGGPRPAGPCGTGPAPP